MKLCLITDDAQVEAAARVACPPPHALTVFALEGLVNAQNTLSSHGEAVCRAAEEATVVLVEWQIEKAPVINTLGYHLRRTLPVPLLALCQGGQEDHIAALAAGADGTATFPLYLPLLQARAVAYHRLVAAARTWAPAEDAGRPASPPPARVFGALRLDHAAHRFFVNGAEVELTPREFALLDFLIARADDALSRDELLDQVWGINFDTGTNMVDVYMHFLRRKLEAFGLKEMIQTVRGYGYRLALPADGAA